MADTKILFSKSSHLDQLDSSSVMESQAPEKPPTYEESAKTGFVTCPPTTSIDANGSIQISMDRLPTTSATPSGSASGSSVSVDQMVDELSALQRAQIHLYKRLQHVKSQTYAALGLVLLMAGLIVIFLATYHHDKPVVVSHAEAVTSHRTGKALVGGGSPNLFSSNSIDDRTDDDTEMLLKHLSRIVTSTTAATQAVTTEPSTSRVSSTTQDVLKLQVFKVNSVSTQEISRSDLDDAHGNSLSHEFSPDQPTVKLIHANVTFIPVEPTTPTTTSTTTTTTTTTTEAETEAEPETEKTPARVPFQDTYNISIVIHSATVPNMDYLPLGRASDTYCDIFIDDVLIGSTPIIDNNNNPNWQYLLPKSYKVRRTSTIRVDLLDRDHLKKDHIGGVVIHVGDLVSTNRMDRPVKFFHGRGDVWVTVKLV